MKKEMDGSVSFYITHKDLKQRYNIQTLTYPDLQKMFPNGAFSSEIVAFLRNKRSEWKELHPEKFDTNSMFISDGGVVIKQKQ